MNLSQLYYFVSLAKTEQMKKTAEDLFVSQPSLSQGIHNLENEIGVQLFDRIGRRIKLNRYGQAFYDYINPAVNNIDQAKKIVRSMSDLDTGEINIGFIYSLGSKFIPAIISSYLQKSQVSFKCSQKDTSTLMKDLQEGKFDIIFSTGDPRWKNNELFPIYNQKVKFIVGMNHPLSNKNKVELKDIQKSGIITFSKKSCFRPLVDNYFNEKDLIPHVTFNVLDDSTLCSLVEQNLGIGIIPESDILTRYNVKTLSMKEESFSQVLYMAQNTDSYKPELIQNFTNYVKNNATDFAKLI